MRVLITGGKGQLGSDITKIFKSKNLEVFSFSSKQLDITNISALHKITEEINPDILINCAAYTKVDDCETNMEKAFSVNAIGAKNCAIVAEKFNKTLFHISTDYIFNGNQKKPYIEYDSPAPLSIYAKSKFFGEQLVKEHCNKFFILRVAGVYGINGENFVKTIVNLAKSREELKVVNDQITTPTYTYEIANQILHILDSNEFGTYHCTCEGECSWYEFANHIISALNINCKIIPCSTDEFPRPAKRPSYSVLENFNLKLIKLNIMQNWQNAIENFLEKNASIL